jgi:anti-sigma factor RsiW
MNNCPRHQEASAYMDDALSPADHKRFRRHLDSCPTCREHLDALLALQSGLRELPSPALGFDLSAQFDRRPWPNPVNRKPARSYGFGWVPAGLAAALSLALGAWLGGLLIGGAVAPSSAGAVKVFDPAPPGALCAAPELCRLSRGMP